MFRTPTDWDPVLVDFDSVALPEAKRSGLTIVGTPGYCAPEQFAGIVSPAGDLFSLGATMLFVATHTEPDRLARVDGRFQLGNLLGGVPARVRRVLERLVEPERHDRLATAAEALAMLREPAQTSAPVHPPPTRKRGGNERYLAIPVFLMAIFVFAMAAKTMLSGPSVGPPPDDAMCTVTTDPPGAELYVVEQNVDFKRDLGPTPVSLSRFELVASESLVAEKFGYQPTPVPGPFVDNKCRPANVTLLK
jgi:serine/threonine protein kinase